MNTKTILALVFAGLFTVTASAAPTGVTVNGVALDSTGSGGAGWKYYAPFITLTNAGPFTISGTNKTSQVRVVVQEGVTCDVTLSNLVLETPGSDSRCAFTLQTNACVSLFLAGNNALLSGDNRAGLEVAGGRTLSINSAPGDDAGALTATGGKYAAGIGGNNNNPSGTITIHGGQVVAYGTDGAAGIGGGSQGAGGKTTINGGHVSASSTGTYGAGIGGGYYRAGGTITINGGTVTAQGGRLSAGIGGGGSHSGPAGTVAINGGTVTATGGNSGAGIGGGSGSQGGTVSISGGAVTAQGGTYAAGIGGAYGGAGGHVAISGGRVTATGGTSGAGIGGGAYSGAGGTVLIAGGTVAVTGSNGARDIGPGQNGTVSGANTFTGGSIRLGATSAFHAPSNNTEQVFCASLTGFEPDSEVTIIGLPDSFGVTDIVADADGCIHLWLPNGTHTFEANGRECTVTIQDGVAPTGVTVNGQEIATAPAVPGAGWAYDAANRTLALTGAGPFTLSGTNVVGGVCVIVSGDVVNPVTLANLTLRMTGGSQCAFMLGTGANVSLVLAGTNALASGYNCAGIQVESGRTLSITNAPGDDAAALSVTGGRNAAGIGGANGANGGTVSILGGIVTTTGGNAASGIGGGFRGAGGTVSIGGGTVTAQGGNYAAGIGGGGEKAGGTVTISGGRVSATGGSRGAGIGGGSYDGTGGAGGAVTISGGTVFAQGSDGGMDIGPGHDTTTFGANTFTGGSIRLADTSLAPIPRNHNGKAVFCATVPGFEPNERVVITDRGNLPAYYGTADIFADDDGSIHLWVPNGTYTFTANGSTYTVELDDTAGATGVTVNGDEVAFGSDDPAAGWTYDEAAGRLLLTNAGPFTISGANTEGKVRVTVAAGVTSAVTLSNLTLRTSSDNRCIFTLGSGANVSLTLAGANELASGSGRPGIWVEAGETLSITNAPGDDAASLAVKGGANAAGIGSGTQGAGGTINIAGGTITATSGTCAAGIGGGQNRAGGIVNISGGTVTAVSTYSGAGIGGGMSGAGGTVSISGGTVTATGDSGGAGIGGGAGRAGGTVTISGGTVTAAGSYSAADIGSGDGSEDSGANTFTGGSILLVNDSISPAPSNNTEQVFCVTLTGFTPNTAVAITGLAGYGVTDIAADDGGAIHLWLPDGEYNFTTDGRYFVVTIQDGVVHILGATSVTVNGEEVAFGSADPAAGWRYNAATCTLSLTNAGPFTLAGTNTEGKVCVVVPQGVTNEVTLSNLVLQASDDHQCVFALETNAVVSLYLAGESELWSADYRAGVEVPAGASLAITNAAGDDTGKLLAYGGGYAAGIGSGFTGAAGTVIINGGRVGAGGGLYGPGIGCGWGGTAGAVTINGGTVIAVGQGGAAGIGGGYKRSCGTVAINGGIVQAVSLDHGAGIGNAFESGEGGTVTISGGTVTATGGQYGAGIGGGYSGASCAVEITGGTVTATGGDYAAGIGGGDGLYGGGDGGTVVISGGTIFAQSAVGGAGIGGGYSGCGGTLTISGGTVTATGGDYAAGIGGGDGDDGGGDGGTVVISGGTIFAQGGAGGADIGPGRNSANGGANTFTGGSICLAAGDVSLQPSNNTEQVFCAVVPGFDPGEWVEFTDTGTLPAGFGTDDIFADDGGVIYLWLPNGEYTFTANGRECTVTIQDGIGPTGVTVNGVEVAFGGPPGSGWVYDGNARTLTLSGAGPFLLSGANVMGGVCVVVPEGVTNTVTLSNLTLRATGDGQCAFALETDACVSLLLAGTNELASGRNRAGLEAAEERTLSITNAPGDDAGALTVTGGYGAAGIGGGYDGNGGTVTVNGGAVTAAGGYAGAGIGGGYNYSNIPNADTDSGGTVTVNGGAVTATGGYASAGIGGGAFGGGGTITINSGAVTAMGGFDGAGIGGGYERQGSTATITGGEIFATGGDYAPGIGGGFIYNSTNSTAGWGGTVAISGGRVMATGGKYAAGIGGGSGWTGEGGDGADLTVSGGTVFATGGADGGPGVGSGVGNSKNGGTPPHVSGTCTFTGGSIRILGGYAADDPTDNNTELVWCVTVTNLTPNAEIVVTALPPAYGVNDLYADEAGRLYFWLPNASYDFSAGGADYEATVSNADTTATQKSAPPAPVPVGVTVNGVELYNTGSDGEGWTYVLPTLSLTDAGPFTLAGTNTAGAVRVVVQEGVTCTVTLSNLTLVATNKNQCAFALETNAVVSLFLAGTNELASGRNRAGLEVAAGRTLSITNAPGDDAGALTATGGDESAGIGGGSGGAGGAVTISGGIVTANGSEFFGAGIGGGSGGGGGLVTISGGAVTANGGEMGAGIGSGGYAGWANGGDGGTVNITGGSVTANGGDFAAGIGGGDGDAGGTTTISGGEVSATGGKYGAGIGGGNNDENPDGIAGSGGTVDITGGRVTATGGLCAAGIGGGTGQSVAGSEGATLTVSGGTLFATGGAGGAPGIGPGLGNVEEGETGDQPDASGTSTFTGGSIRIDGGYAAAAPSNNTARVWCVTVPDLTPNAAIAVGSLGTYGVNDLYADEAGKLYLWLPNAYYDFTAGGADYEATVSNADTTATPKSAPPVSTAYLTFSSADTFKVKPNAKTWNGTLEYSTNGADWNEFTTAGADAALDDGSGEYRLYLCGTNNTVIIGNKDADGWTITAAAGAVACSGDIETLLDYKTVLAGQHPAMADYCFANLFRYCTALNSAPELPATTLTTGCYYYMFGSCTGLTNAPALPATTLAEKCCQYMFSGCTGLTQPPALPATTLARSCYSLMFNACTGLTQAPELPAATLVPNCYQFMFSGCSGLTNAPALQATTLASYCYANMFNGCTGLTRLPELPATQLANYCYQSMFNGCTGITLYEDGTDPTWGIPLGAQTATGWNNGMLAGTGGDFTGNPEIGKTYYYTPPTPPSTAYLTFSCADTFTITPSAVSWNGTLFYSTNTTDWIAFDRNGADAALDSGSGEYRLYFRGTGNTLISGGNLAYWTIDAAPASVDCSGNIETLLDYATVDDGGHPAMIANCFANLFKDCTALGSAPELPATNLINNCYVGMFRGCTGLTNAPVLPATTLTGGCYQEMFRDCTSLAQAPALPAMTLPPSCYKGMFTNCTALATAPELPANTLGATCYQYMFAGCTDLTNAPALQAMTLATGCYHSMFFGCTGLTQLPVLPATNLASFCYAFMFADCTGVTLHETGTAPTWGIPKDAVEANGWNTNMLAGTGGTFTGDPVIGKTYYYNEASIPPTPRTYVTFTSASGFSITPQVQSWDGTLEYSTNTADWTAFTTNAAAVAAADGNGTYTLHFSGTGNTRISPNDMGLSGWLLAASGDVAGSGDIGSLLDYATVANGGQPAVTNYAFANLFSGWTALTSAPELPATNLARGCYYGMFRGCTSLAETPELPATNLARTCYASMFFGCTALTNLPTLAATTLAENCYAAMFKDCTGIALHAEGTAPTWGIPDDAQEETGWNTDMLDGTGGTFTGNPAIGAIYYYTPSTPPVSTAYITFSSTNTFNITPLVWSWDGGLEYSTDAADWHELTTTGADAALGGFGDHRLHIRGTNNTCVGSFMFGWNLDATAPVACSGNIETLLDYPTVEAGDHPVMGSDCFGNLFKDWTWLVSAPALPATTLTNRCYASMFEGCTSLESAPALPATTLAEACYRDMFNGCTSLTDVPGLPAGTLADYCYNSMFNGCTNLAAAPALAATNLADHCCQYMFEGCTSLTNAPGLPAATLADSCCFGMFKGCTSLAEAPELPAMNLASYCCYEMFAGCTALTNAPALPAETLADHCYYKMFTGCTSLAQTPLLASTNLASHCYANMFEGCTGLTRLPELPATTLDYGCYNAMFKGCTGIKLYADGTAPTWGIPDDAQEKAGWNTDMLLGTGGSFTGNPVIGALYYYTPSTPPVSTAYLTFSSTNTFKVTPQVASWDGTLEYSTDAADWHELTTTGADAALGGFGDYRLHIRGTNNTCVGSSMFGWNLNATAPVICSGNIETLLDYPTVEGGANPAMGADCFGNLFRNWTWLVNAPALPATTLANGCYQSMFEGCTRLESAPALPAATLAKECYRDMFNGCTSLTDVPGLPAGTLADYACNSMFKDCTSLATAPALAATNLANYCCQYMFEGCTSLESAPALAAGTLATSCYASMFNGCTSLAEAPELSATNLASYCCYAMFSGCTGLTNAPALPATTLANQCYYKMFNGCTSLTETPALAATNLASHCYANMFEGCTALTRLPELTATALATACYNAMFKGCTGITLYAEGTAPTWGIPAGAQEETVWNQDMLAGTGGGFTGDPVIGAIYYYTPSTPPGLTAYLTFSSMSSFTITPQVASWDGTLEYSTDTTNWTAFTTAGAAADADAPNDYRLHIRGTDNTRISDDNMMAPGWTLAATAPVACSGDIGTLLDYATVLGGGQPQMADFCFANLFRYWKELVSAPALPAKVLSESCYDHLFHGCSALETAPTLPAETLADDCYSGMFRSCKALTETPALAATNLADACYAYMFAGCTGLTNAPALPATQLASICYQNMFTGCTNLTEAPVLPATNLAVYCYASMFEGCTGLTRLPELPATQLANNCYEDMFKDCTGITLSKVGPGEEWGIPAGANPAADWNTGMLAGTGGTFTGDPVIGRTYYYAPPPPPGLTPYLTFASMSSFTITPQVASWDGTLEYSTDTTNWTAFTTAGAAADADAPNDYRLHIRGTDNTRISDDNMMAPGWTLAATAPVACSGNIETLLDYATVMGGGHPQMADFCFANLFRYWRELVSAPALPATTLSESCYDHMFHGCSALETAPTLPAETLADDCYAGMFRSCKALTETPALAATNLADACYAYMFAGCTALTNAPTLPATQLASICYQNMFTGCTNLTEAPVLPATNLAVYCYASMFEGCTGLTRLPELPATQLANNCYEEMFKDCTGITLYAEGTAPIWGIPAGANPAADWNTGMLAGTGGTFTGNPVIGRTYYYTPIPVPVVFDATGGTFADGSSVITQVHVAVYGTLPDAARDGYTLVGWFDGCTNGAAQAVTGEVLLYNAPHTLHARWTAAPDTTPASIFAYTNNADGTVTITGFADPNQQVTKLVLPDMIDGLIVTAIAPSAFANSTSGMTEVHIPVFCTSIGDKAFLSIPTITRLVFPNTRDWRNPSQPADLHIGKYAFSGATGLTELTFPAEVASLGNYAFSNTRNLQRITILGHPVLGNQVFRSAGMDTGGITLHLDPALAANEEYMAKLTAGMKLAEVKTDAIITGLRIYMIGFAPSGNVILGVIVEKAAEWGDPDPASIWVRHRARLSDASAVLIPVDAELEEDGTVTLEVARPEGDSAFFRAFVLPPEAD